MGPTATESQIAPHAGGQIDNHVGIRCANALDHLPVKGRIPRADAGLGVANVAVGNGGTRPGSLQRRLGDLLRRDRNRRVLGHRVTGAGDGTADEDLEVHDLAPCPPGSTLRSGGTGKSGSTQFAEIQGHWLQTPRAAYYR
jgi:hypothetical protein